MVHLGKLENHFIPKMVQRKTLIDEDACGTEHLGANWCQGGSKGDFGIVPNISTNKIGKKKPATTNCGVFYSGDVAQSQPWLRQAALDILVI